MWATHSGFLHRSTGRKGKRGNFTVEKPDRPYLSGVKTLGIVHIQMFFVIKIGKTALTPEAEAGRKKLKKKKKKS